MALGGGWPFAEDHGLPKKSGNSDIYIDIEYKGPLAVLANDHVVNKLTASQEVASSIITPPVLEPTGDGPQILMANDRVLLDRSVAIARQTRARRRLDNKSFAAFLGHTLISQRCYFWTREIQTLGTIFASAFLLDLFLSY